MSLRESPISAPRLNCTRNASNFNCRESKSPNIIFPSPCVFNDTSKTGPQKAVCLKTLKKCQCDFPFLPRNPNDMACRRSVGKGMNPGFGPLKGNHQQGMVFLGIMSILIAYRTDRKMGHKLISPVAPIGAGPSSGSWPLPLLFRPKTPPLQLVLSDRWIWTAGEKSSMCPFARHGPFWGYPIFDPAKMRPTQCQIVTWTSLEDSLFGWIPTTRQWQQTKHTATCVWVHFQ